MMRSFLLPRKNCPMCGSSELQTEQSESRVLVDVLLALTLIVLSFVLAIRVAKATEWLTLKLPGGAGFASNMAVLLLMLSVPFFVAYGSILLPTFSGRMVPTEKSSAERKGLLFICRLRMSLVAIILCGAYLSMAPPRLRDRVTGIAVCLAWELVMCCDYAKRFVSKEWKPRRITEDDQ